MVEVKVKLERLGDAGYYGLKNNTWINMELFNVVVRDLKRKKMSIPIYSERGIFVDGVQHLEEI